MFGASGPLYAGPDAPPAEAAPKIVVDIDNFFGKHRISACEMDLASGKTTLVSSGRDADTLPKYIDYVQSLTEQNGLMEKLGMKLPPHRFLFVPGQLAGVLSTMNMVPMGHYHDGAQVAQAQSRPSGILELVYPGGQHSFYRDDVSPPQQITVINHAYMGHAWFAIHNRYTQNRTAEAVSASYKLYETLEQAYLEHDPDEVAEWYSFLVSTEWDQDLTQAVEESPEQFKKFAEEGRQHKNKKRLYRVPRTRNLLQYLVAQLPAELPSWKLEIAAQFEKLRRYIPAAINTKFMNEGWAMLMEELVPEHSVVGSDFVHFAEYCCMVKFTISGNLLRDIGNPYYLGLEAWRILREHFHLRPDMFNKSKLEKDRAFIAWATSEVINKMNDRAFLDYALSDRWILRRNLTLTKDLGSFDPLDREVKGDPSKFNPPGLIENVSKDPKAIRRALVRSHEEGLLRHAMAAVRPLREPGGVVELEMVDGHGKYQPLKSRSLVAKLWVLSRMFEKPVAMESTYITKEMKPIIDQDEWWTSPWVRNIFGPHRGVDVPVFWRLHTTVYPDGRVHVAKVRRNGVTGPDSVEDPDKYNLTPPAQRQFEDWPEITARFQNFLDAFLVDWYADANYDEAVARVPRLAQDDLLKKGIATAVDVGSVVSSLGDGIGTEVFDHSPTVPRSLHEFQKKVARRFDPALKKAVLGKTRPTLSQGNLRVRVLPTIPKFEYNLTLDGKKIFRDKKFPNQMQDEFAVQTKNPLAGPPVPTADIRAPLIAELMRTGRATVEVLSAVNEALSGARISRSALMTVLQRFAPPSPASIKTAASNVDPDNLDDEDLDLGANPNPQGEVHWGPGKPPPGKGSQDGDPVPGQEGDEPGGDGRGDEANDPTYVDVPPDIWGRVLAEEIELPNTRPLDDEDQRRSKVVGKKARRKAGVMRPELIAREAFKLGLAELQNEGAVDHPDDLLDALAADPQGVQASGYRRLREQDWWVKGVKYRPSPDIKAVVYIITDLSGSMGMWFNTVKRMSVDLQAILRSKYPAVEMRFVPFDGRAVVLDNVDQLLRINLGGGTRYGNAFRETRGHMDKNFPYAEYDRYVVIQGDLIDFPQGEDWEDFLAMHARAQFSGVLHTGYGDWDEGYAGKFKEFKNNDEFFGYEHIEQPQDYVPLVYRALFKNPPKEP